MHVTDMLDINGQGYDFLVNRIRTLDASREPEGVLRAVQRCCWFAGEFHPGRFADGAIENKVLDVGSRLHLVAPRPEGYALPQARPGKARRILHVAPGLALGGHTQLMTRWITGDAESCHSVVLTAHSGPIHAPFAEAVRRSGGEIVAFPPALDLCQQAKWLREAARHSADLVVWHLIGPDVVPAAAFAAPELPPVLLLDHADHVFWLGTTVADIVVNLRTAGARHSLERRFARHAVALPIPLPDRADRPSRAEARRKLGLDPARTILLSVGREMKYRPCGPFDFLATAGKILDQHPEAELHVVGATQEGLKPWLRRPLHERIRLVGAVSDPSQYHAAADLYLESYPFGSQTALLEAALSGLPAVPAYAPLFPLLVTNDDSLLDLIANPVDEAASIARTEALLSSRETREMLGATMRKRLLRDHVGDAWIARLQAIYRSTDGMRHAVQAIPEARLQRTRADVGLSQWCGGSDVGSPRDTAANESRLRVHRAVVAKVVGDYPSARAHAWHALRRAPFRAGLWRLLLVSALGPYRHLVRTA